MQERNKTIIGIIAEKGGGKGLFVETVKKLLPGLRIFSVRFSDPIRDILGMLDKEVTRDNLSHLTTALRQVFQDEGILNPVIAKRIEDIDADIVILDGIRKKEEAAFLKKLGAHIVYITARAEVRFERRRTSAENADEKDMTWEQFVRQDQHATEKDIREVGEQMGDTVLDNNGTAEEFEEKIGGFLKLLNLL